MIKDKWDPEYKFLLHENDQKFSKKVGIFPKIGVSPKKKKFLTFTRDS